MQKLMLGFLVGIIALAPALAAAQSGSGGSGASSSGAGSSSPGAAGSGSSSGAGSGSGTSSGGATTGSSAGGSSTTSPSASPSGDFAQYTTQADCEKAGGLWQFASNKCEKKP
jgi:hypothetical protein